MILQTPRAKKNWSKEEIAKKGQELGNWFHNLDLQGVKTAPNHFLGDYPNFKFKNFATSLPRDLKGKTVLDIGCNAGFYSLEMKRRGADRVVAIDFDEKYLAQAKFAAEVNRLDVEFHKLSVYDVAQLGEKFDLVIFMGVFYHLRHPLLALDLIHEHVSKDLLLFQSMQRGSKKVEPVAEDYPFQEEEIFERPGNPKMFFIEHRYAGDPTNWWVPNRACTEAMLRSSGFEILTQAEEEVYLCRWKTIWEDTQAVYPSK
ncbi:MAG: TIGR04290 family methyltransferase [Verrucomicrobiales bacterium]